jgi:hypothetical protein
MVMKKSIGRTLAHIDVAANTSVRIHEDFFNTHRDYHYLSQVEIDGAKRISQHLSNLLPGFTEVDFRIADYSNTIGSDRDPRPDRAVIADSRDSII